MLFFILLILSLFIFPDSLEAQLFEADQVLQKHQAAVTSLALRAEDNLLLSGDEGGSILVWDLSASPAKLLKKLAGHTQKITDLSFNSSGNQLISASYDGRCLVWDLSTWETIKTIHIPAIPAYRSVKGNEPTFAVFHPNDQCLFYGGYNMAIHSTHLGTEERQAIFSNRRGGITCGRMTPSGSHLVFGVLGQIYFYNLSTQSIDKTLQKSTVAQDYICELAFVPGSSLMASWNYNGEIQFWDYTHQAMQFAIKATPKKGSSNLVFSDDGRWMLTGNLGTKANLWDLESQRIIQVLEGHQEAVISFAISQDMEWIATGGKDHQIHIWRKKRPQLPEITTNPSTDPIINTSAGDTSAIATTDPAGQEETAYVQRDIAVHEVIEIDTNLITVSVFDNRQIDGDIISINYNDKWILKKYTLQKQKKILQIPFTGTEEQFIIYAHNLGSRPPNTIAVEVDGGTFVRRFNLKSDLGVSSALQFIKPN